MQTCKKCGSIIPFVGGNCPKCGRDDGNANAAKPNSPSPFSAFGAFGAANAPAANNANAANPFGSFGAAKPSDNSEKEERPAAPAAPEKSNMNNPFGTFGMANPPAANNANAINPFKPFTPAAAPKAAEKPNNNRPGAFAAPNPPAEEKPKESNPFKPFAPAAAPKAADEEKPNNNRPFGAFGANNAPEPAAKPNQNNPFAAFGAFGGAFGAAANNNANNDSVTPFGAASAATLGKNTLLRDLKDYRELISETEELKAKIKPQSEFPKSNEEMYKKRSFIKYFWPFVVAAPVAGYLIYIISYGIMMSSVKAKAQMGLDAEAARAAVTSIMGDLMGGIAVAIIVAAAIIIFGIIICRRKQGEFNSNAEYMNNMVNERYQKGLENQRMIDLYQEDISKMRKYETMVPKEYQNYSDVGKMIELLEEDRATTIEGCCDIIKLESL